MNQTLDQEINEAISKIDRIHRKIQIARRQRQQIGDRVLTTFYNQLDEAKAELSNLQLQYLNQIHDRN